MAMKIAKQTGSETQIIIPTSAGLFPVSQSVGELNLLSKAVNDVDFSQPFIRREHHSSTSKYKPKASNRVKPVPVTKPKEPQAVQTKSPPTPTETVAVDDSLEYGMWLEFHDDLTKRIKTYPYPPSPRDKVEAQRRSRGSQRSKKNIENFYAVGHKPRAHRNKPIPMHITDLGMIRNCDYQQELVGRYCDKASIARTLPLVFDHLDHIADVTQAPAPKPVVQPVNTKARIVDVTVSDVACATTKDVIEALESIVEADKQTAKVESVTVEQMRYDDKVRSKELKIYEEYLDLELPAANDESYEESNPPMMSYNPWSQGISLSHRKAVRSYELKQDRAEGSRYMAWLNKHSSSIYLRETTERARKRAMPGYELQLGTEVHPLYHHSVRSYDKLIAFKQHRRIAAAEMGEYSRSTYGQWINAIESMPVTSVIDKWLEDIDNTEKLAEKITESVSRKEGMANQISFKQWAYMVESQYINTDTTSTGSSSTPIMKSDPDLTQALSTPHGDRSSGAGEKVVSLADARIKRDTGMATLLAKFSGSFRKMLSNLDELSTDQKKTVIAYLKASC